MKINEKKLEARRPKLLLDYFFKRKHLLTIIFAILTVLSAVASYLLLKNINYHILLGAITIIFFLLTLLSALGAFTKSIKERELEVILQHDRDYAYEDVFTNLAIENSKKDYVAAPMEIVTPELFPGRDTIVYRYNHKRDRVYYSQTGYTWLLFGKKNLFHYHVSINHIYGLVGYECAQEISYSDIVNVKSIAEKNRHTETLSLILSLTNGEEIKIVLRNRPNKLETTRKINEKEAELVSLIRKTIRDNK